MFLLSFAQRLLFGNQHFASYKVFFLRGIEKESVHAPTPQAMQSEQTLVSIFVRLTDTLLSVLEERSGCKLALTTSYLMQIKTNK